ncbi:MAG: hypothetical protein IH963_02005 [Chloroflexi bacterium]|nr:hypothetical protein [Chloroflexota bacterium]
MTVLDLKMPVIEGQELFKKIEDAAPDMASNVLFITGDPANPENCDFLSSKSNLVLIKPFELKDFRRQLSALMYPD